MYQVMYHKEVLDVPLLEASADPDPRRALGALLLPPLRYRHEAAGFVSTGRTAQSAAYDQKRKWEKEDSTGKTARPTGSSVRP